MVTVVVLVAPLCVQGLTIQRLPSSARTSSFLWLASPVSAVSVCTAELCCCQDDGMGGIEILADLKARKLPYPIDEAPCLGACGGGAMVAIDFDDGTSSLVTGLEETLMELGLSVKENYPIDPSNVEPSPTRSLLVEETGTITDEKVAKEISSAPNMVVMSEIPAVKERQKAAVKSSATVNLDVRERMRTEALKDEERSNPWLKAASYLAGKATERIFGEKRT